MDQPLVEIFEQARGLVAEADRKLAEAEERKREKEREASLTELAVKVDAAFDFTSREKLQLDQRLDIQEGRAQVEFVVRSVRAIFTLIPQGEERWMLSVLEEGREPKALGEHNGGVKADAASRRLAAARVVAAIGDWSQKLDAPAKKPAAVQARWRDQVTQAPAPAAEPTPAPERREPTYGTFGKFLGY
jgi:hypothetical protein